MGLAPLLRARPFHIRHPAIPAQAESRPVRYNPTTPWMRMAANPAARHS